MMYVCFMWMCAFQVSIMNMNATQLHILTVQCFGKRTKTWNHIRLTKHLPKLSKRFFITLPAVVRFGTLHTHTVPTPMSLLKLGTWIHKRPPLYGDNMSTRSMHAVCTSCSSCIRCHWNISNHTLSHVTWLRLTFHFMQLLRQIEMIESRIQEHSTRWQMKTLPFFCISLVPPFENMKAKQVHHTRTMRLWAPSAAYI